MTMNALPAMAALDTLHGWIAANETLLGSALLAHAGTAEGSQRCMMFLSRDADGDFLLRACEGHDEGWMTWRDLRRFRSPLGRHYARAMVRSAVERRRADGWELLALDDDSAHMPRAGWSAAPLAALEPGVPALG